MEKKYMAVIQAGGKGTRMFPLTNDRIPKPMLVLNGKPMIQWQIENLLEYGTKDFIIITGHLGEKIESYFGNGEKLQIHITYVREDEPLGSAGALYFIKEYVKDRDIIMIFGDIMMKIDWNRMIKFHESKLAVATLLVHPNAHPFDSDLLLMNENNQILGIDAKTNVRDYWYENLVNAGIYIFANQILDKFPEPRKKDLEKDILAPMLKDGNVYGYRTSEYVKDVGTPDRFSRCCEEQKKGIWDLRCLNKKQKAVFIDRDGTINKFNGLISREEQLELEEKSSEAIRLINEMGYLAICVTNQPVVARGMCSIADINNIHKKMQTLLGKGGAYLDDIIFCPHHPDKGYPEENPQYKIKCSCRKPSTGMIQCMAEKHNIDILKSWMIGDSTLDMKLGDNAGTRKILVKTGQAGKDKKFNSEPDYIADDLLEAVRIIQKEG